MQNLKQQLQCHGHYIETWTELQQQKTMIITGEQGYGDELLFSRVLVEVQKVVPHLIVVTGKPLQSFFQFNYPEITFIGMGEPIPQFGRPGIATMADMFCAFCLHHQTLPSVPMYQAPIRPISVGEKPRLGFVYKAGTASDTAKQRSLSPQVFRRLADQYELHCFQVPAEPQRFGIDRGTECKSFLDTAERLTEMDRVASCDTAFVHLALNLGKPTMLVYDEYLDWRWKTPLYPAVKVVQQKNLSTAIR